MSLIMDMAISAAGKNECGTTLKCLVQCDRPASVPLQTCRPATLFAAAKRSQSAHERCREAVRLVQPAANHAGPGSTETLAPGADRAWGAWSEHRSRANGPQAGANDYRLRSRRRLRFVGPHRRPASRETSIREPQPGGAENAGRRQLRGGQSPL